MKYTQPSAFQHPPTPPFCVLGHGLLQSTNRFSPYDVGKMQSALSRDFHKTHVTPLFAYDKPKHRPFPFCLNMLTRSDTDCQTPCILMNN